MKISSYRIFHGESFLSRNNTPIFYNQSQILMYAKTHNNSDESVPLIFWESDPTGYPEGIGIGLDTNKDLTIASNGQYQSISGTSSDWSDSSIWNTLFLAPNGGNPTSSNFTLGSFLSTSSVTLSTPFQPWTNGIYFGYADFVIGNWGGVSFSCAAIVTSQETTLTISETSKFCRMASKARKFKLFNHFSILSIS